MNDKKDFNNNTNEDTQEINLNVSNNYEEDLKVTQNKLEYEPNIEDKYIDSKKKDKESNFKETREQKINRRYSFKISFIAIVIMIILACGIVSLYPGIKSISVEDNIESPYENYELLEGIYETNYVLYKDVFISEHKAGDYNWDDIYLNNNDNNSNDYRRFRNYLYNRLDYTVISGDGNAIDVLNNNNLEKIINQGTEKDLSNLRDYYGFYMVIRYDNDGYANVENVYGADRYSVRNIFSEFTIERLYGEIYPIEMNPIKNTTFIYGIPKNLIYKDKISQIVNYNNNRMNIYKLTIITLFLLFGILILGLFIPYKVGKKVFLVNLISKISVEINLCIFTTLSIFCGMGAFIFMASTLENIFEETILYEFGLDIILSDNWIIFINILVWTVVIYCIFLGDMYLKNIFNYGIIKYIKDKSIIIKCLRAIKRIFRRIYKYIIKIDLNDKSNKFLIKILGFNLIIMIGCCIFWGFGIVFAFIYTALIFYLARKHYKKLRDNFQTLLNLCNQMQNGNLEVVIDEDLGIFNTLKNSIQEIQQGFKKAVNEEVKSQRMKTELISNVSHDLKTPLTSIITYVDLLKKENITEEERKSYIDTLDKKSQRLKFLIEDLFEVSKATTGNVQLNIIDVDIIELLRQVQIELYDKFKNSDLIIKNNFPENKIVLQLDSQKTFRIFENLLNNVSKYAMKGSRVYVDMEDNNEEVIITIKNISAVEMNFTSDEIIERFQRGDKSRNTEGSGLGLAIAKSFVEIQNGQFIIEIDGDLFKVIIVFKK